mgnify:CR=1 FL=1
MPPLNLLIKPASGSCNMRCRYCFYTDETQKRETALRGRMSSDTLHLLIDQALAYADSECTFSFQGGEPTLAGIDFFRDLSAYAAQHPNPKRVRIHYAVQTNGYALDEAWAAWFAANHVLVGVSLDGRYIDCGCEVFSPEQDVHAGGSGCGCSACCLNGWLFRRMLSGEIRRLLFLATGALMSTTTSQQGESIPAIAPAVTLEVAEG